jgi:hypothetical protein
MSTIQLIWFIALPCVAFWAGAWFSVSTTEPPRAERFARIAADSFYGTAILASLFSSVVWVFDL